MYESFGQLRIITIIAILFKVSAVKSDSCYNNKGNALINELGSLLVHKGCIRQTNAISALTATAHKAYSTAVS